MTRPRPLPAPLAESNGASKKRLSAAGAKERAVAGGSRPIGAQSHTELFIWFEDNRDRHSDKWRGSAGFPECLLPYGKGMRVVDRRYAEGHVHLLAAVRLRCDERLGETVATIYTAALALGTIAWIGTGEPYRRAWMHMYPRVRREAHARPDSPAA